MIIVIKTESYILREIQFVRKVTKTTIVIELKGIKIAATIGVNSPLSAKYIPIRL